MITYLTEVPGARERPGGCPIQIACGPEETVITIPPRGVSPIVLFFACILLGNLLLALYTGLMLLIFNQSVLMMAQITPGGLPVSLRHYEGFLTAALLAAEALGFWTLAAILRPISARETLMLDRDWVRVQRRAWSRTEESKLARADLRGFHLRRDPKGLDASALTLQGRGESIQIGEFLREADREWLLSAGNALLQG